MALWAVGRYFTGNAAESGDSSSANGAGADTVERICERLETSSLLEDRRDSVRALKSLSRKFRLEVGTRAMPILLSTLQADKGDAELASYVLVALLNVLSDSIDENEDEADYLHIQPDLGDQFTEIFIKDPTNVELVLELVDIYDASVRVPAIKLVTVLLTNRCKEVQEQILQCPVGVPKCMDLLVDGREYVRNLGILLLAQLTRGSTTIQKIAAFSSAFERLLDVIEMEGYSDGGVVVEDCLHVLLNLLVNNSPNQTLFKEGSYISRLAPGFLLPSKDTDSLKGWSAQKVSNSHLMLQLLRALVSPSNQTAQLRVCQKSMLHCGLLDSLCKILMASGVPVEVSTETTNTVAEIIRGDDANQTFFYRFMAPSSPPKPAIVVLLMSMVDEKQPFSQRCAAVYCFNCVLLRSPSTQADIVGTLLPTSAEESNNSAGQFLCSGLFSPDSLSSWLAAVALMHAILDNEQQKEQLLRVRLAIAMGTPPVSLLQLCTNLLLNGASFQTSVGLLQLLIVWMLQCPLAVKTFLSHKANLSHVISECAALDSDENEVIVHGLFTVVLGVCVLYNNGDLPDSNKDGLLQVIDRRITQEVFLSRLSGLSRTEAYTRALKRPAPVYSCPSEVIFVYEFTRVLRKLEADIVRAVEASSRDQDLAAAEQKRQNFSEHESVVSQYKELINDQDRELQQMRTRLSQQDEEMVKQGSQIATLTEELQQMKDKYAVLRATQTPSSSTLSTQGVSSGSLPNLQEVPPTPAATVTVVCQRCAELEQQVEKFGELQLNLESSERENSRLSQEVADLHSANTLLTEDCSKHTSRISELEEERDSVKNEHEDLLVLLADQDTKMHQMSMRLKELGEAVSTEDEDDLEDEEEEEEEENGDP